MVKIFHNYNLADLNTFRVKAKAKLFAEIRTEEELQELLTTPEFLKNQKLILGGGSNILLTQDFDGLVIHNLLKGISVLEETDREVFLRAMGGEVWHELVLFTVARGYWGIENLAYIPGSVGAAPMQNIGAYGSEIRDVLENIETVELSTGRKKVFFCHECGFGYRDSCFKNELKGKFFIAAITLRLSKISKKNLSYKSLKEYLEKNNLEPESPKDISDAVTHIRKTKLPDPKDIGNAGSFFKNVFVGEEKLAELLTKFPEMPFFKEGQKIKIPAAWLVEQCGFKGKKFGSAGVHDRQALVLVNHGDATGGEIKNLAYMIIRSVKEKFGLTLAPEVNLI